MDMKAQLEQIAAQVKAMQQQQEEDEAAKASHDLIAERVLTLEGNMSSLETAMAQQQDAQERERQRVLALQQGCRQRVGMLLVDQGAQIRDLQRVAADVQTLTQTATMHLQRMQELQREMELFAGALI
jgi:hypothetical protein